MELNNFIFKNQKITIILDNNGIPWFYADQIAKLLEFENADEMIQNNIHINNIMSFSDCQHPETQTFVNLPGINQLIGKFSSPIAVHFKNWVISEALPFICKYDSYQNKKKIQELEEENVKIKEMLREKNKEILHIKEQLKNPQECKEYTESSGRLEKNDIIYIVTNDKNIKKNIFKLGKTKINNLKKRLTIYNTNSSDKYYYVYYKEVFSAEQVERTFKFLMSRFNIQVNNKIDPDSYQLYFPDFEFYLEKIIEACNELYIATQDRYEDLFFNSKSLPSIVNQLVIDEGIPPVVFENLNIDVQRQIIKESIQKLPFSMNRFQFEIIISNHYNIHVTKKIPFWNLVKEVNKEVSYPRVTYF